MLIVFDQVPHCLVGIRPLRLIIPMDLADAELVAVLILVMVAAVGITLTTSDLLPQLADPSCLTDIPAHYVAIEEVGCMDVVTPAVISIPLLNRVDVPDKVLEDRMGGCAEFCVTGVRGYCCGSRSS